MLTCVAGLEEHGGLTVSYAGLDFISISPFLKFSGDIRGGRKMTCSALYYSLVPRPFVRPGYEGNCTMEELLVGMQLQIKVYTVQAVILLIAHT